MNKLPVLILLMTFLAFIPANSFGEMYDGVALRDDCNEFLKYMNNKEDPSVIMASIGHCLGYLQGHIDFQQHLEKKGPYKIKHCFPIFITLQQLAQTTVVYLEKHPDKLNKPAMEITLDAFAESFPCNETLSKSSSR